VQMRKNGRAFMTEAVAYLKGMRYQSKYFPGDHCFVCNATCPRHPPPAIRGSRAYAVIGGNTCTPWSSMNVDGLGWLADHSIPFIIWLDELMSVGSAEPDLIIQECVGQFDVWGLMLLVSDKFIVQQAKYSPKNLGIPVNRLRSYTVCVNKAKMVIAVPFTVGCLREKFFRRVVASSAIFFRAPASYLQKMYEGIFKQRRFTQGEVAFKFDKTTGNVNPEAVLAPHHLKVLGGHLEAARAKNLDFMAANLINRSDFIPASPELPALLRQVLIWGQDLTNDGSCGGMARLLTPCEAFAAQGIPVLLRHDSDFSKFLPKCLAFSGFLKGDDFTNDELHSLAGNSMNISQVSLAIIVGLFGNHFVRFRDELSNGSNGPVVSTGLGLLVPVVD
jgi:hypothetical protein